MLSGKLGDAVKGLVVTSIEQALKKLEVEIDQTLPLDRYKATYEQIVHSQIAIKFLVTQEAKDLEGEKVSQNEILKNEQILKVKRAELEFLRKLITE